MSKNISDIFSHVEAAPQETLNPDDLTRCIDSLPAPVCAVLRKHRCCVAGGYIRDTVARVDSPKDVDIFTTSREEARVIAQELFDMAPFCRVNGLDRAVIDTDRSFTIRGYKNPQPQVIFRWVFQDMAAVIDSFDFTNCKAAIWCDGAQIVSRCAPTFYEDVEAQQLVYTSPGSNDPLSSICRLLKFTSRGYHINDDNLGALLSDLVASVCGETLPGSGIRESVMSRLQNCNNGKS